MSHFINITTPEHAYFFGFALADGHLSRGPGNKGKLTIEISAKDLELLQKFDAVFPNIGSIRSRSRSTNFSTHSEFVSYTISALRFRDELVRLGFPECKKSNIMQKPDVDLSERDFYRGIIDGDGSVGFTKSGKPFVSLVISSERMYEQYREVIFRVTGEMKNLHRNRRDGVYNVVSLGKNAVALVNWLYVDSVISLNRKLELAQKIMSWTKPDLGKNHHEPWTSIEKQILQTQSFEEACAQLDRSPGSIESMKNYLKRKQRLGKL